MYCPKCGVQNPDDSKFCRECGSPLEGGAPSAEPQQPQGQQQGQFVTPFPGVPLAPTPPSSREKKNIVALVLGIIGVLFAFVGAVLWASCSEIFSCSDSVPGSEAPGNILFTVLFVVCGIGGSVLSCVGSIQAFNYARGRFVLSLLGFLCQIGCLIVQIVMLGTFSFIGSAPTVIAVILLCIETVFAATRKPKQNNKEK